LPGETCSVQQCVDFDFLGKPEIKATGNVINKTNSLIADEAIFY